MPGAARGGLPSQASTVAASRARRGRYTAENLYGMVGFGAGPVDALAAATGDMAPAPSTNGAPAASGSTLVLPANMIGDPAFWMVATLGAVLALAAYSAGPAG